MTTTEQTAPLVHPLLPPLPDGLAYRCQSTVDARWPGPGERDWTIVAKLDAVTPPDAYDWLVSLVSPTMPERALMGIVSHNEDHVRWYGEHGDRLQRHIELTMADGSKVTAYQTKPNPAAPSRKLAALDRIHALMDGTMWDTDTMQAVSNVLESVGYVVREPAPEEGDPEVCEDCNNQTCQCEEG